MKSKRIQKSDIILGVIGLVVVILQVFTEQYKTLPVVIVFFVTAPFIYRGLSPSFSKKGRK